MDSLGQFLSEKRLSVNPLPRMGFQRGEETRASSLCRFERGFFLFLVVNLYEFFNCIQHLGGYNEV